MKIDILDEILQTIMVKFHDRFVDMDFFFSVKDRKKTIFSVLRSLPGMRLSIRDIVGPDIMFESTRTIYKHDSFTFVDFAKNKPSLSHNIISIPGVREISVFTNGFEVISTSIDVYAVLSTCLLDKSVSYLISCLDKDYTIPILAEGVNNSIEAHWQYDIIQQGFAGKIIERSKQLVLDEL